MEPTVSVTQNDWSLHRKGPIDQERHKEKIKEAVKEKLADVIAEESIITSDGKRIVKVPIRSLDHPRFRFDYRQKDHVGQGPGDSKVGDVIAQEDPAGAGAGKGKRAGNEPGVDYYEAELSIDELADLIFEDLELPNLEERRKQEIESETIEYADLRKRGPMANLDKRRTILENIKRNALAGAPQFGGLKTEDLRFRTWKRAVRRESNAVVLAMRDVSGSMGEFEKHITRSTYFWMVRFLRKKYDNVKLVFITHHADAKEVDEETFFRLGESGGTKVSTAYKLALNIIEERFNPEDWNIYAFHFSDGDNWGDADNRLCVDLVGRLLQVCNLFGYGEIAEGGRSWTSTLMSVFQHIEAPRFIPVMVTDKREVYAALRRFFGPREGVAS